MYYRPAEWRVDKTIWLSWPFDLRLWGEDLVNAQQEFIAIVTALQNEHLVIIFPNKFELDKASNSMPVRSNIAFKLVEYGDIWLRDTLPIFVKDEHGKTVAVIPRFNGWGGKYLFPDDLGLATRVANLLLVPKVFSKVIFEGGAIECDGAGTLLTTEQCLLNPNRNNLSKREIEEEFENLFGAKKIIWIKKGLKNDHTDGHIDTLARFIGPQNLAIMVPTDKSDPNYEVLLDIKHQLANETDAHGNRFDLVELPSPGSVVNGSGELMPASYLNFLMGDQTFLVPLYGEKTDSLALEIFKGSINLPVIGLKAKAILSGGGAFHCISQEFFR